MQRRGKKLTRKLSSNFFFSPRLNVSLGHATDQFSDTTMLLPYSLRLQGGNKQSVTLCNNNQTIFSAVMVYNGKNKLTSFEAMLDQNYDPATH